MYKLVICTASVHEDNGPAFSEFKDGIQKWICEGFTPLPLVVTPILFDGTTSLIIYSQALYKAV